MAGTGQVWQAKSQREKEAELLYIGEEFRKAITSYYNTGPKQYPESLEDLLQDKRTPAIKRHLRKIYTDPITNAAEWGIVEESSPGNSSAPNSTTASSSSLISSSINKRIIGVYSLSEKKPIKKDKFPEHFAKFSEALTYQDWKFSYKPSDAGSSTKPASTQSKPNATSPTASPFAPQSSSKTNPSPFSPQSTSPGNASPFAPQSASPANSKAPAPGFPSDQ